MDDEKATFIIFDILQQFGFLSITCRILLGCLPGVYTLSIASARRDYIIY
nr:MAG TPA: hypothetical protein [Caudoviricetes sp.]